MANEEVTEQLQESFSEFVTKYEDEIKDMIDSVVDAGDPTLGRNNAIDLMYCCFVAGVNTECDRVIKRLKGYD